MEFPTFTEWLARRDEGLWLPDRPPLKGMPRITRFPARTPSGRSCTVTPAKKPKPFALTIRKVMEIVPTEFVASHPEQLVGRWFVNCHGGHFPGMLRHSAAQRRHSVAHRWQWSNLCFSHSVPQASQISAQMRQMSATNFDPRLMYAAAAQQIAAQSRSSRMHSAIIPLLDSLKQASQQCSHSSAHLMQASMQD